MRQMKKSLILSALGFSLFLSACSKPTPTVTPVPVIQTKTIQIARPAPIVPMVDQLRLKTVSWKVVTPDNIEEIFQTMDGDIVLFAITPDGYEALATNLSDLRALIEQQKEVIAIYKRSYQ
jgi:hypothetical protein